jgi:hypothetical protein
MTTTKAINRIFAPSLRFLNPLCICVGLVFQNLILSQNLPFTFTTKNNILFKYGIFEIRTLFHENLLFQKIDIIKNECMNFRKKNVLDDIMKRRDKFTGTDRTNTVHVCALLARLLG